MKTQNWLFVTGTPRSGTTFVGRVLSIPLEVDYLHEPFNPDWGIPGIDRLYLYIRGENPATLHYRKLVDRVFSYDFTLQTGSFKEGPLWRSWTKKIIGSRSAWSLRFAKLNPFHRTMILKDPIGCLLTGYLAQNFGVKPVVIIRHPVAVIASRMRLGWDTDRGLEAIRGQQELIEDYFSNVRILSEHGPTYSFMLYG